jgi:hypothetical protein
MLIVSDFHDYYDTAMTYGIDKTVVFNRRSEDREVTSKEFDIDPRSELTSRTGQIVNVREFLIGFCGKVYPGIIFERNGVKTFVYDAEKFFIEAVAHDLIVDWKAKNDRWSRLAFWRGGINAGYAKAYFAQETRQYEKHFYDLNTPIFSVSAPFHNYKRVLTKNPKLKDFGFQKIKDAPSAFQDIYMFISGVLGTPKDIPSKQTDKEKAASHGHDGEYSFKKPPGGKRWR